MVWQSQFFRGFYLLYLMRLPCKQYGASASLLTINGRMLAL